jgi:pilus assembly protein CpaF
MSYQLILPFFPEELRELLLDPSISDLMINGVSGVFVDRNGVMEHIDLRMPYTTDRLQAAIERVARILGQDLTHQNPILNTRLPDGSRVAVVGAPSSIHGPTLTVRKFNRWYSSDELIQSGSLPEPVRDTVVGFINEKRNGLISGGTGSGKTTLMKALLDHIPQHERLVVIEQPAELKVAHPRLSLPFPTSLPFLLSPKCSPRNFRVHPSNLRAMPSRCRDEEWTWCPD